MADGSYTLTVGGGSYTSEVSWHIIDAAGDTLYSGGAPYADVVSFGETQPLIVTQGRERANRRTVTEVSGFVGRHPTVLDGKYAQIIYRDYVASAVPPTQLSGGATSTGTTTE